MSIGAMFILGPRGRRARPASADQAWPDTGGWLERRACPDPQGPTAAQGLRRRASDHRLPDGGSPGGPGPERPGP